MKKKPLAPHLLAECARLKEIFLRKKAELGLTQEKAAAALGMNQGSFSHYLNGRNALNVEFASRVARLLNIHVVDFSPRLQLEIHSLATTNSDIPGVTEHRESLALHQLTEQANRGDPGTLLLGDTYPVGSYESSPEEVAQYQAFNEKGGLSSVVNAGPRGYWIEVVGPSMCSLKSPSFPDGSFVLVNRDEFEVISGRYYVARHQSGSLSFKQVVLDTGRIFLTSLNSNFPPVELTSEWEIVGRVVDVKMLDL